MKNIFSKFKLKIKTFFAKIADSKVMKNIDKGLTFVPSYLADHLPHKKRKVIWGIIFIIPLLIGFVYFFFIPFLTSLIYSFSFVRNVPGEGIVTNFIGWKNYIYVFTEASDWDGSFPEHLTSAVIQMFVNIPVIVIFSLIMAVVLNSKFKGRAIVRAIFFMPVIFNSQAIDMAMGSLGAGVIDATINETTTQIFANMFSMEEFLLNANLPTWLVMFLSSASNSIYDIITYSGVQILIFLSALQSVPKHLYEAADMEGATQYEKFWKITFPMVSPMMLTVAIYTIVDSFLSSPLIGIINSYNNNPRVLPSDALGDITAYGVGAAMSWVYALVSIIIIAITMLILSRVVFYYDE